VTDLHFYGSELANVHHEGFGDIAAEAASVVVDHLRRAGLAGGRVIDLGSGSGILARHLTDAGHPVLGVDLSPAMVARAELTAPAATFRCGSVHDVDLTDAAAITATGEIANYAQDERAGWDALSSLVRGARAALAPGGLFLFDLSGPGRAGPERLRTATREGDGWFITAVSTESEDGSRLDRSITLFHEDGGGCYRRLDEHHTLVLFEPERVVQLCERHGFTVERRSRYGRSVTASTAPFGWDVFAATAPRS
jgi:SAM-dependent methyltransferase